MLFIKLSIDKDFYCIEIDKVIEIIPIVKIEKILKAVDYVAGFIIYNGKTVPVIDLSYLYTGKKTDYLFSSRIILLNFNTFKNDEFIIGLLSENVTETVNINPSEIRDFSLKTIETNYINKIIVNENNVFRWINTDNIIPHDIQNIIFYNKC